MNRFELKPYQKEAASEIVRAIKKFENVPNDDPRICVLDMPTGMGKTVVLGEIMNSYVANNYQVVVLTPGAGGLDVQIRNALQNAVPTATVDLITPSLVGSFNTRSTNSILVSNWESLVSRDSKTKGYKNKLTRETEISNLFDFFSRSGGAPVLIVIDEAHHGSSKDAQAIRRFLDDVRSALGYYPITIEASATPMIRGEETIKNYFVHSTPISEGRKEALIRSAVVLNDGINDEIQRMSEAEKAKTTAMTFILEAAFKKQEELRTAYLAEGVSTIPLIGIPVPNGQRGNEVIEVIKNFFAEKGITEENHQLALFLSENKSASVVGIASDDSPVRVLIYKQAIATGWDCPRAQITVGFRSIKSRVFSVQNRGRYYRTTGARYYNNPRLNKMYIYSDEASFIKGVMEEGGNTNEWVQSVTLEVIPERLAVFQELGLWSGYYKRTNRGAVDMKLVRSRMAENLGILVNNYMKISRRDHALGTSFAEVEVSIDRADKDGFSGVYGEGAIAEDYDFNDFINEIKDYITKPEDGKLTNDFGNNHRVAEKVREGIVMLLRRDPKFQAQWKNEAGKIDFAQFVVQQFGSIKRQGAEMNENARHMRKFIDAVFTGRGAPSPILTEKDGSDGGACRETRDLKFAGSWTPPAIRDAVIDDERRVGGLRAMLRLYTPAEDGATFLDKLSKPEEEFEEFLVSLYEKKRVKSIWFEKNGTGLLDFALPVNNGGIEISFYPDYYGAVTLLDGTVLPFVFEVKGREFEGQDARVGNTRAKSEALHQFAERFGIAGSVVYPKDGEWVTARKDDSASVRVTSLLLETERESVERPVRIEWNPGVAATQIPYGVDTSWFERLGVPGEDC